MQVPLRGQVAGHEKSPAISDAPKRSEYVRKKVAEEGSGDTERELEALEKLGCARVCYKGDARQLGGDWIDIRRADYPKHDERMSRLDESD